MGQKSVLPAPRDRGVATIVKLVRWDPRRDRAEVQHSGNKENRGSVAG